MHRSALIDTAGDRRRQHQVPVVIYRALGSPTAFVVGLILFVGIVALATALVVAVFTSPGFLRQERPMALQHSRPGEVIDVRPLGPALVDSKTHMLAKTEDVEILRLVLPAGKEIPMHVAPGVLLVHCLEGKVAFTAFGNTQELESGTLVYLPPKEPHSVRAIEASSLLVTILRKSTEA